MARVAIRSCRTSRGQEEDQLLPEGWSEIEDAWHTMYTSEEVRDLVAVGVSMARQLVERRADVIAAILGGESHEPSALRAA